MCLYVYNACNCHPIQHQTSFYTVCITAMLTTFYRYHFSDTNACHCKNICTTDPHHLNYGHRTFPFSDIHTLIVLLLIMQGHRCKEEAGGGRCNRANTTIYSTLFNHAQLYIVLMEILVRSLRDVCKREN